MREILFRGKRLDNGEWVEGLYLSHLNAVHYIIPCRTGGYEANDGSFYVHRWFAVDPATVGQYTGLTDKNGKRIFEGDIVEGCDFDEEDGYGVVEWHDGAFEINNQYTAGTFHENYWGRELEVIGNIHDNQALLEGGEGCDDLR